MSVLLPVLFPAPFRSLQALCFPPVRPRPVAMAILTPAFCTARTAAAFSLGICSQLPGRSVPSISKSNSLYFMGVPPVSGYTFLL